ncbi:MAG: YcjF family protein [Synechocystis sp.]|nr:YcjF family protein [Synechocystis sp.]
MAMQNLLRKPILVGGLGVCALLGGLEYLTGEWDGINQLILWGLSGLGFIAWRLRRSPKESPLQTIEPLTNETLQAAIAKVDHYLSHLQSQTPDLDLTDLQQQLTSLTVTQTPPGEINGVILGEKRTGKSSLLALLPTQTTLADSGEPLPLNWQAIPAETDPADLETLINTAHFVWVLTTGDLTATQWQCLEFLHRHHHHWQLIFNKQDLYADGDRQTILDQLQHQTTSLQPTHPVAAISADPRPIQIRRHLADGQIETDQERVPPQLGNLLSQVDQVDLSTYQTWQRGVQWRQAQTIQQQAHHRWQENRRALALPLIEQAQWLTAGTALVNPVANLDLLAAIAINGQLVFDLSQLYHQKMSLAQAKTVATQLGEILIKLGLVELSTQALGGLLKSQPLTYLAGGALQGLSAAYLTRIAGLSLVTYLEAQAPALSVNQWDWRQLTTIVKQTFDQNQRLSVLQGFWQTAQGQLSLLGASTVPAKA